MLVHKREHALAVAAALEAQVQADAVVAMAATPGPSSAEEPLHADLLVEPDLDGLSSSAREGVQAYKPDERLSAEQWSLLAPLTRRLIAAYRPDTEAIARKTGSLVAPFSLWALQHQLSMATPVTAVARVTQLRAAELVEPALLELYVETLKGADASIAKTRSVLRRCLRGLDPTLTPRVIAYQPVAAPYSARECAAFVRLCRNQPTATKRRQLSIVLALALGAGLDGRDLRGVRASDITEHTLPDGSTVLLVQITGDRPRTVAVRALYAPLLREALAAHHAARRGRDALLLGKDVDRRNVTGPALDRAVTATGFDVDVSVNRLRSTWLVACLTAGVPLPALLPAAGLRSARTIADLLTYCPVPPVEQVTALLAGAADVPLPAQAGAATRTRGRTPGGAR